MKIVQPQPPPSKDLSFLLSKKLGWTEIFGEKLEKLEKIFPHYTIMSKEKYFYNSLIFLCF